jgi:hypothetical protein
MWTRCTVSGQWWASDRREVTPEEEAARFDACVSQVSGAAAPLDDLAWRAVSRLARL